MKSVIMGAMLLGCAGSIWAQAPQATNSAPMQATQPQVASQPAEQTNAIPPSISSTKVVTYKVMTDFKDPTINTPWTKGQKALEEQRWFKPAGNNAAEYYLQARQAALSQKNANPAYVEATQEALRSLFPYVLMSAEAAWERNDKEEAMRLISLLGKMDPNAPAVQRLNLMVNAVPAQEIR